MGKKRQKRQQSLRVHRAMVAAALVAGVAAGSAGAHLSASLLAIQPFDVTATVEVPSSLPGGAPASSPATSVELPAMPVGNPYAAPAPDSLIAPAVQPPATPTPESFTPPAPVAAPYSESIAAPQFVAPAPLEAPAPTGGFLCTFFAISCGEPEEIIEEPVILHSASSSSTGGGFLCTVFGVSCGQMEEVIEPYAEPITESISTSSDAGVPPWQRSIDDQSQVTSAPGEYGFPTQYAQPSPDTLTAPVPEFLTSPPVDLRWVPASGDGGYPGLPQVAPPPLPSGLPAEHSAAVSSLPSLPSHPVWMPQEETLTISPAFAPDLPWLKSSTTCGSAGVSWAIQQCPASVLVNPSPQGGPGLQIMTTVPDSLREQQTQFLDLIRERTGTPIEVIPGVPPGEQFILHEAGSDCEDVVRCPVNCADNMDNDGVDGMDSFDPKCIPLTSPRCERAECPSHCDNLINDDGWGGFDRTDVKCTATNPDIH